MQAASEKARRSPYRPDIDGLRALAVTSVVLFHYFPSVLPSGFAGVDVFFVISGFLITSTILVDLAGDGFSWMGFYARRCRRILPALLVVLMAACALGARLMVFSELRLLGEHVLAGATFTSNLLLAQEADYFDTANELKPLLHLWSLAVEEQFYLVWPALLLAVGKLGRCRDGAIPSLAVLTAIAAASFAFNLFLVERSAAWTFYLLPTRFWELLAGCILAFEQASPQRIELPPRTLHLASTVGLGCFVLGMLLVDKDLPYPGWLALFPVTGTFLFLAAGPSAWLNRLLAERPFVYVGLISYPLYLWHWPLLAFARVAAAPEDPSIASRLGLVATAVALAALTRRFVEEPVKHSLFAGLAWPRRSRRLVAVGVASLAVAAIAGTQVRSERWLPPSQKGLAVLASYADYRASWDVGCFAGDPLADESVFQGRCWTWSSPEGAAAGRTVFFWGDSHSANLDPGLADAIAENHASMAELGASGCPPVLGFDPPNRPKCKRVNEFIVGKLRMLHPRVVVLTAHWTGLHWPPDFFELVRATVAILKQEIGVSTVLVVGEFPVWDRPLSEILERIVVAHGPVIPIRLAGRGTASSMDADRLLRHGLEGSGVVFVPVGPVLCNSDGCLTTLGDHLATDLESFDTHHLTDTAARRVVKEALAPALASALSPDTARN